jgi:hypothetical protein
MTSFDVHLPCNAAVPLLLLAAVAAPCTGSAQLNAAADVRGEIADRITELQAQAGPYSSELIDPLKSLSVLYQESGNHALASAVLDQAMQVIRANYGLRSLEQAPLLQQRIRSEETRGDFAAAWDLEQDLLSLARRQPDDLRSVPILHEIGDKRMALLRTYLRGALPPQLYLGCYYQRHASSSCTSGLKHVAAGAMLSEAQHLYLQAIRVFLRQQDYSSDELRELETKLIRSAYAYGGAYAYSGAYSIGRQSMRRLVSYDVANEKPLLQRIDTLIQIADWDLLFDQRPAALGLYEETYAFLKQRGVAQASIDALFSPETPYMLPTFAQNPADPDRAQSATGHVDIAFEVTRYGTSRRIDVVSSSNASKDARSDLVRLVTRSRFRPVIKDGEFAKATPVVVRYYVQE